MIEGSTRPLAVPAAQPRPDQRRWAALAVLCSATFIIILDGSIVFVAIPSMAANLNLAPTAVQWVLSSYLLSFGGLLLLGGRAADLLGRRRMFMVGATLLALSSLACGFAWSGEALIAARAVQGFAAAIMTPTALSILTTTFAEGPERNRALGFWSAAGGIGGTTGALIGGPLTDGLGWSWIFFVNVPVALLIVALSPIVLRESYDWRRTRTFDVAGAVTSTAAMVLIVYAIVDAPRAGWTSQRTASVLGIAVALLVVFLVIERFSRAPLVPLHLFRSKALVGGNLVMLAVGMAVHGAMGFIITQYAQIVLGYSAVQFGLMFAVMTVLSVIGSISAGTRLINRFGPRPVAVAALTLLALGCLALTQISTNGSYLQDMFLGMALFGPGLGAGFVAGSVASLSGATNSDAGLVSGFNAAAFHIGGALGIAILATVVATRSQGAEPLVALTEGYRSAFAVAVSFAWLGLIAALALLRRPAQAPRLATT